MADKPLTEIAPSETQPSSTRPAATPLTREQMSAELGKNLKPQTSPEPKPQPKAEPAQPHEKPKEYQPRNPQDISKDAPPDFREKLREKVLGKKEEEKKPEEQKQPPEVKKKEAVSADDAPPPEKPKHESEEVPEEQRQVLPHDKPDTARRIKAILAEKSKLAEERAQLAKELEEARATAKANPTAANVEEFTKLKEEHAKASDELVKFRRRYELDNDPEIKTKFDEPLAQTEAAIETTLKKYNLGDATLKAIKDEGGFAAFSRSMKTFPIVQIDPDTQEKKTIHVTASELARSWLNTGLAVADAEFIKSAVGKQQLLSEEKKAAVTRAVDDSKQYFESRQKQQQEASEAAKKKDEELAKGYQNWLKTTSESTEWLKDKPIPENAPEEQKKQIQEHNEFNKQLRDQLATHPKTSEDYYKLKLEAAESHHLRRELGSKDDRIKSLEAELARVKAGTRTTSKPGSLLSNAHKEEPKAAEPDYKNPMESLKKGLRAKMAAKSGNADDE